MGTSLSKETEDELWGRNRNPPSEPAHRSIQSSPSASSPKSARQKSEPSVEDELWGRDQEAGDDERRLARLRRSREVLRDEEGAVDLKEDSDDNPEDWDPKTAGPVFPNGEINWDCPCLGNAAHGPCGTEFRGAFSCFIESKEDPKGADCLVQFREMQLCFTKYPELYARDDDEEDDELDDLDQEQAPLPKKKTEKVESPKEDDDDKELEELVEELFGDEEEEEGEERREKQKTPPTAAPQPKRGRSKEPVVGSPAVL